MSDAFVTALRVHAQLRWGGAKTNIEWIDTAGKLLALASEELERKNDHAKRLQVAVDVARSALLTVERKSEEGRAALTAVLDEQAATDGKQTSE